MPEVAHDDAKSPRAEALGYPDANVLLNQTADASLVFIPADPDLVGDEAFVVASPDSHVDVVEVR